jgi:signal transduction histidine kinase
MRLARKVIVAAVLGVLVVVLATGYLAVRTNVRGYEARVAEEMAVNAWGLSVTLKRVVEQLGPQAAKAMIAERNVSNPVKVRWLRLDAPPGDEQAIDLPASFVSELRQGRPVRIVRGEGESAALLVYRPFYKQEPPHDVVEAAESLAPLQAEVRRSIVMTGVQSIAILVVGAGLSIIFGIRFIARPVQALAAQARRVGAGNLSQRLALAGHDELSELATEMNAMCDRLEEARDRVSAEHAAKLAAVEQMRHGDRLATVGQLASGVAHELGTPLNVISAHAELIRSGGGTPDEDRDGLRVIVDQTARMTAIIRQLLDFARREGSRLEVGDPVAVVERTTTMLAHGAGQRNVELLVNPTATAGSWRVRMDAGHLQQVVANLVLNATQAMPHGGRVEIDVAAARAIKPGETAEHDYVRIAVADQGVGISPENLPRIFEPFFTTKDVGEGTGLGLSVCYGIVEEHGGFITVDSTVGTGSRFSVFLPATTLDTGVPRHEPGRSDHR